MSEFYRICREWNLKIPEKEVIIYEAESLSEFHNMTQQAYDIGGVYFNDTIVVQPFRVLKRKKSFEKVLIHELLHWVLQEGYDLPKWFEEGFIMTVLGVKPQDLKGVHRLYLEKFLKEVKYEDIHLYLDTHCVVCGGRACESSDVSR